MRIGIIANGKGESLDLVLNLVTRFAPGVRFFGFSDRDCEALEVLKKHCEAVTSYHSTSNEEVSSQAYLFFRGHSCDNVVMSFSRLVTAVLWSNLSCYNVHPSLLPGFPGLGAVKTAYFEGALNLGVTVHQVDFSIDGGPIICQAKTRPEIKNLSYWYSISFLMKTLLLTCFLIEKVSGNRIKRIDNISCNPHLTERIELIGIETESEIVDIFRKIIRSSRAADIMKER